MSVIICTRNRCRDLSHALDAILAQRDAPPHEVIVVDNNSTDATRDVVEERMAGHPHLRYVVEPVKGLPHARNRGVRDATAPIVAFTDDDVIVAEDWLASIVRAFQRYPQADCLGGPVLPRWPSSGMPAWYSSEQVSPLALQDKGKEPFFVGRDNAAPCLIGANFAFRSQALEKAGLFSPDYVRTQDREIQLRLWKAGGIGVYVPDVLTYVDVPQERLTKDYYRLWFRRAGRFHSRMGLLDVIDVQGRMVSPPDRDACLLGVPFFLYRQLVVHLRRAIAEWIRRDPRKSFYHENRARYLASYIRERWRGQRISPRRLLREFAHFVRRKFAAASGGAKRARTRIDSGSDGAWQTDSRWWQSDWTRRIPSSWSGGSTRATCQISPDSGTAAPTDASRRSPTAEPRHPTPPF